MAAGRRKRRPKAGAQDGGQLPLGRAEVGQEPVLAEERRPEKAGVVGREGHGDAGPEQPKDRMARERVGAGRQVGGEADVQRDSRAGEAPDEGRVGGGADAVRDPARLQPAERLGDGVGASRLARVNDGGEAEAGKAAVDGDEVPRREGELVPAEAEPDGTRPGVARVQVEDPVRRVGAEVPDRVEEDADAAVARPFVGVEDPLDGVADGGPRKADALDDGRRDVDLGVNDPAAAEAGRQVAREKGEVVRPAQEAADVAVQGEKARERAGAAAGADGRKVGEEGRVGAAGEADERRGADGPFEMEVELGLRAEREGAEGVGDGHGIASYGRRAAEPTAVPSERLWLRAAAFGLDLICLAGGPLLLATVVVFLVGLIAPDPPAGLPRVFRAAQALFVLLFLFRDVRGASPGKALLGLSVVRADRRPLRARDSVLRNLPLLVPGLNLLEALSVLRRPDSRRLGDRLAGTAVGES